MTWTSTFVVNACWLWVDPGLGTPGIIGSTGRERSGARIGAFPSTQSTTAFLGALGHRRSACPCPAWTPTSPRQHPRPPIKQDRGRPSRPRLVGQPLRAGGDEPRSPAVDRRLGDTELGGDLPGCPAPRAGQHDLRAQRQHQIRLASARPRLIGQARQPMGGEPGTPLARDRR